MPINHEVRQGDCIDSIAFRYGFFPDTLWNHGDNAELKERRKDPNILMPGDVVVVPDLQIKEESRPPEQKHKFKRKGVPAKLRLRLMKPKDPPPDEESDGSESDESHYEEPEDDSKTPEMEPRANVSYILEVDGIKGEPAQTDGDGKIEVPLPPNASKGRIILNPGTPEEESIPLDLGGMDPVDTPTGARKRLNNLGYLCGPDGHEITSDLKEALMRFQYEKQLQSTGELDQATQDKLKELHGC